MRIAVYMLALVAGLKIWMEDTLFREAAEAALVAAYRERAIEACRRLPQSAAAGNWTSPHGVSLVVGDASHDVSLWQLDHPMWQARYKTPYLVLSLDATLGGRSCAYDLSLGSAAISKG